MIDIIPPHIIFPAINQFITQYRSPSSKTRLITKYILTWDPFQVCAHEITTWETCSEIIYWRWKKSQNDGWSEKNLIRIYNDQKAACNDAWLRIKKEPDLYDEFISERIWQILVAEAKYLYNK